MRQRLIRMVKAYQTRSAARQTPACRFDPTCSDYAIGCFAVHGSIVGSLLAVRRILRCRSNGRAGRDPVPRRGEAFDALRGRLVKAHAAPGEGRDPEELFKPAK